nr:putative d-arabinono-1,4-lactone oxidase [Quercus suber]
MMDSGLREEIAKTSPEIPFRSSTSHTHHTWARTFRSRPELYIRPQSLEEIQKIVTLARRCRRRIVVVGCGHSPSDLTCTSSWMVNLDNYSGVLKVDKDKKTLLVEGGIRLANLNTEANKHGLTIPNLGSIDEQSIVGAIATATHGSSLKHGLLSDNVRSLRIVLSNGRAVRCSAEQNQDLFRASLISLGALGIITELEYQMTDACNIEWTQTLLSLSNILERWETNLWTEKEFTRVWWMPYMKRVIVWSAEKTTKSECAPVESFYGGSVGFHTYHNLLWLSNYVPWILPAVEWFVFGLQYGFKTGNSTTAVEPLRTGLLMNCLYSQFVNEWALPLRKGPEAISRLSSWLNGEAGSGIPFSSKGLYVHCPIEVRVSDTSIRNGPRPFLDNTVADGPTLYLNATLYRPYHQDPPCRDRYYEAFEWLMRDMGGKPHYAKNFQYTTSAYIRRSLGPAFSQWQRSRDEADPEGMFLGEWHARTLGLGADHDDEHEHERKHKPYALLERELSRHPSRDGGQFWVGQVPALTHRQPTGLLGLQDQPIHMTEKASAGLASPSASSSVSSFDMMHGAEAQQSVLFDGEEGFDEEDEEVNDVDDDDSDTDRDDRSDSAFHVLAAVQLAIESGEHDAQDGSADEGQEEGAAIDGEGEDVAGGAAVHVGGVDGGSVGDGVDGGEGGGAFGGGTGDGVGDPGEDDDVAGVDAGDHEHHGDVAGRGGGGGGGEDEGGHADDERDGDVQEAFAGAVGVPGVEESGDHGEDVGGRGQEQAVDLAVAQRLHDRGEEVGHRRRGDDAQEEQHEDPDFDIFEREHHAMPERLLAARHPVIHADVLLQAPDRELALFLRQPLGRAREIGQDEKGDDGNETCESPGDQGSGVEHRGSESEFFAGVPAGKIEETAREVCSLYEAEEESNHHQIREALRSRSRGGDDAPHDHDGGEVQRRLTDLVEEQVGRDLHKDVADEKNADAGLVLRIGQVEVSLKPWISRQPRSGDIVSVEIVLSLHGQLIVHPAAGESSLVEHTIMYMMMTGGSSLRSTLRTSARSNRIRSSPLRACTRGGGTMPGSSDASSEGEEELMASGDVMIQPRTARLRTLYKQSAVDPIWNHSRKGPIHLAFSWDAQLVAKDTGLGHTATL